MNIIDHYRVTKIQTKSIRIALLSLLPDIFILLRQVPWVWFRRQCLNLHSTDESVVLVSKFNKSLGIAWRKHKELDEMSHNFKYESVNRVPKDSVLLLSGGLDSFAQWRLLGMPNAVYFSLRNRAQQRELDSVLRIKNLFGGNVIIDERLNLGSTEYSNGYIPFRNLFFIMLATTYSSNVIICQINEWAPDKNLEFYRHAEHLLSEIGSGKFQNIDLRPRIYAPFHGWTKTRLVREYSKLFPISELTETVSCYSESNVPCGKCTACVSRHVAMVNNSIREDYQVEPDIGALIKKLNVSDFRLGNVPMYMRRYFELRQYRRKSNEI